MILVVLVATKTETDLSCRRVFPLSSVLIFLCGAIELFIWVDYLIPAAQGRLFSGSKIRCRELWSCVAFCGMLPSCMFVCESVGSCDVQICADHFEAKAF